MVSNFIKKEYLDLKKFDVEQAATLVEQKMLEIIEIPFVKTRTLILELCAFFGAVAMQYHSCTWKIENNGMNKLCILYFPEAKFHYKDISVLAILWRGWYGNTSIKKRLIESYQNVMIPYTYEELREFLEKEKAKENRGKIE